MAMHFLTQSCLKVSQLWIVDPRCNPWDGEAHKVCAILKQLLLFDFKD